MNIKTFICALLFASPSLMASAVGDIDFFDTRGQVTSKLKDNAALELAPGTAPKDATQGGYLLREAFGHQKWRVYFQFDKKTRKLGHILLIGSEGVPDSVSTEALRSYYMYILKHAKEQYFVSGEALNAPEMPVVASMTPAAPFLMHSFERAGGDMNAGLLWDKDAKMLRFCIILTPPADDTAMGRSGYNTNTKGSQDDWLNIADVTTFAETHEFCLRAGIKKEKKPVVKPAEPQEPAKPTIVVQVSDSLPPEEQDMIRAIAYFHAKDYDSALPLLQAGVKREDSRAIYYLSFFLNQGLGKVIANEDSAALAMTKSAQLGYAYALIRFGTEFGYAMEELGISEEQAQEIIAGIQKAAQTANTTARFNLALMYRYGFGLRKDVQKARALLEELAQDGDVEAKDLLKKEF